MNEAIVDEGAKSLGDLLRAADLEQTKAVFHFMRLLLTDGEPVTIRRLAGSLGISDARASTTAKELQARGGEFDEDGNMIGFGLTLVPTPHEYQVEDRKFYVWCSDDALIFPTLFDHTAVIRSPDPLLGETIEAVVSPQGVERLRPDTAVATRVSGTPDVDDVRGSMCSYGHFFSTPDSAAEYVGTHKEVNLQILPVSKVFRIGKILVRRDPSVKTILSQISAAA
ncbi:MAG: organomercurial lyase MerB [Anaerolineae bacterium]|nr:MAG: organomercurial lyase MerB [Anaerolineae bacterium]